ncbi:RbAp46 [Toxoplasma gondii MAS]|uniref:RbAp46 n=2 Tax=Toxoplasma gondii TaxID=5811 RepID=A0A086QU35_TOXGO|nr:RbAp46 [Toxoplasma gondii MAS]PUA90585.1 RbAp46 [Toxoplasma gondii TgCATBr9]
MPTAPKNAASPAGDVATTKDAVPFTRVSCSPLAPSVVRHPRSEVQLDRGGAQNASEAIRTESDKEATRRATSGHSPSSAASEQEGNAMTGEEATRPLALEPQTPASAETTAEAEATDTKQTAPSVPVLPLSVSASLLPTFSLSSPKNGGLEQAPVPGKRPVTDEAVSPSASRKRLRKPDGKELPDAAKATENAERNALCDAHAQGSQPVCTADAPRSPSGRRLRTVPEEGEDNEESDGEKEDEEEGDRNDPAVIAEEFNNWKVNTKVLYDLVMNYTLEWPSLTVQWLPGLTTKTGAASVSQRLLIGTHTSSGDDNSLLVLQVSLPAKPIEDEAARTYVERPTDYDGFSFGLLPCKFKTVKSFPHEGEVNVARFMPQKADIVATMGPQGFVSIYDLSMDSAHSEGAVLKLPGHTTDGFGLAWNAMVHGRLASTSNAGAICLHDVQAAPAASAADAPLRTWTVSKGAVNDCCWIPGEAALLASCGDDGIVSVWDMRDDSPNSAAVQFKASEADLLTCLCADEQQPNTIVCGDNRGHLRVFDRRRGEKPVHMVDAAHDGEVTRVAFAGCEAGLLSSAGRDRFVSLWDLKKVGEEQSEEDAEDGPPELLFSHGGHVAAVSDMAWNREDLASLDKVVASVGEDNRLQIWQLKRSVFFCADDEDNEDDDVE